MKPYISIAISAEIIFLKKNYFFQWSTILEKLFCQQELFREANQFDLNIEDLVWKLSFRLYESNKNRNIPTEIIP